MDPGTDTHQPTLGLALSGGAVLGCAHIGVLQALDECGIRVTHLAGTSIGALVAAFYASGCSGKEIQAIAEGLRWKDLARPSPSRLGLFSQDRLRATLRARFGDARIEDAAISTALVTTDISTGEKVVLTSGDLAEAASASACFPGIFLPVEWEGKLLVDGGLTEHLPVSPLKSWGVERIIAVDAFIGMTFQRPKTLVNLIKNSVDIVLVQGSRQVVEDVDLLIAPDLYRFSSTELRHIPEIVQEGYEAAMRSLEMLEPGR